MPVRDTRVWQPVTAGCQACAPGFRPVLDPGRGPSWAAGLRRLGSGLGVTGGHSRRGERRSTRESLDREVAGDRRGGAELGFGCPGRWEVESGWEEWRGFFHLGTMRRGALRIIKRGGRWGWGGRRGWRARAGLIRRKAPRGPGRDLGSACLARAQTRTEGADPQMNRGKVGRPSGG